LLGTEMHEDQLLGAWTIERRFRTGKIEFNDYDYLKPNKQLRAPNEGRENYAHSKLEVYDYSGKYDEQRKGDNLSRFRLEAEQSFDHRRYVDGDAASLFPGSLVTVERHPISDENRDFLVVCASHHFGTQHCRTGYGGGGPEEQVYYGNYEFLPGDTPFRMLPTPPKPHIYGIQTAKVLANDGEDGEEISTNENGHIWVQFYWMRDPEDHEKPQKSCPVRVAQWLVRQTAHSARRHGGGDRIPRRRPRLPAMRQLRLQRASTGIPTTFRTTRPSRAGSRDRPRTGSRIQRVLLRGS
jgi:type VI secretion system secreted protein VgrG